tara:strand:+ start:50 stop:283 length:234 start_codon:yes stop_codon:yes gene_type:complete
MSPIEIKRLLIKKLPNCEIKVDGNGSHFDIGVIGEVFAGLKPVQRQQLIYEALNTYISDGSIHAVNIKTYTPDEPQW